MRIAEAEDGKVDDQEEIVCRRPESPFRTRYPMCVIPTPFDNKSMALNLFAWIENRLILDVEKPQHMLRSIALRGRLRALRKRLALMGIKVDSRFL